MNKVEVLAAPMVRFGQEVMDPRKARELAAALIQAADICEGLRNPKQDGKAPSVRRCADCREDEAECICANVILP